METSDAVEGAEPSDSVLEAPQEEPSNAEEGSVQEGVSHEAEDSENKNVEAPQSPEAGVDEEKQPAEHEAETDKPTGEICGCGCVDSAVLRARYTWKRLHENI